jgi:hypothetical protein
MTTTKGNSMTTTVTNKFHGFSKTIRHKGNLPSASALLRAIRDSKPRDCKSTTTATRDDGMRLGVEDFGNGPVVVWFD